jgi:uncharacterized membrane protein
MSRKLLIAAPILAVAALVFGSVVVLANGPGGWRHGMGPDPMWPFGLLSLMSGLLIVAGVVLLAIWAIRTLVGPTPARATATAVPAPSPPPYMPAETPLDILARRFASGEMTAEEYQTSRDLLTGGGKS